MKVRLTDIDEDTHFVCLCVCERERERKREREGEGERERVIFFFHLPFLLISNSPPIGSDLRGHCLISAIKLCLDTLWPYQIGLGRILTKKQRQFTAEAATTIPTPTATYTIKIRPLRIFQWLLDCRSLLLALIRQEIT